MPANVESMMWLNEVPWHGLGNEISENDAYDLDSCIKASGLDWSVETKQCYINLDDKKYGGMGWKATDAYATVRTSDQKILGVVGERYEVLQNIEAFKIFQPFLDNRLCRLNTAGSLDEGRKIWILAEILGEQITIRPDDHIRKFILLSHGHDGKSMVRFGLTPIRVVCSNTLSMAHGDRLSQLFKVKHTQNMINSLNDIKEIIQAVNLDYGDTADAYKALASVSITKEELDTYIKKVFKINGEISTRSFNITERVKSYFTNSPGARGESWYDAYNAVTYYLSHDYGNNANNRLNSLWFGKNSFLLKEALEIALI